MPVSYTHLVEGMDQRISISEETVNTLLLLGSNVLEATLGKVTVFLDEMCIRDSLKDVEKNYGIRFSKPL